MAVLFLARSASARHSDEVFVTGTAAEVTPVSEIDEYRFTPGQITRTLLEDYDSLVRGARNEAAA